MNTEQPNVDLDVQSMRDELIRELRSMTKEQVAALLYVARVMHPGEMFAPPTGNEVYDEANDPAIGLLQGPVDLAARAKEILRTEMSGRSGWTQKN